MERELMRIRTRLTWLCWMVAALLCFVLVKALVLDCQTWSIVNGIRLYLKGYIEADSI